MRKLIIVILFVYISFFQLIKASADKTDREGFFYKKCKFNRSDLNIFSLSLINNEERTIYFFYNKTKKEIYLNQYYDKHEAFPIYRENKIPANNWSVFATDRKKNKFYCSVQNERRMFINCKNVLDVCRYENLSFGTNIQGEYWVVHNSSSLKKTKKFLIKSGFLLK